MENVKFCTSCGAKINSAAVVCPSCGVPCSGSAPVAVSGNVSSSVPSGGVSPYSKTTVLLLCFFLGGFGVHQFYVGNSKAGVTRLVLSLLLGIGGIIALVDFVHLLCGTFRDGEGRIVGGNPASAVPSAPVQAYNGYAQSAQSQTRICRKCGVLVSIKANYCTSCGEKMSEIPSASETAEQNSAVTNDSEKSPETQSSAMAQAAAAPEIVMAVPGKTKYCTSCGSLVDVNLESCPVCHVYFAGSAPAAPASDAASSVPAAGSPYNKTTVLLLCFFLGGFGVHQFYVGNSKAGITRLVLSLLLGIGGIIALVDFIKLLCGTFKDGEGRIVGLNPASPDSASSAPTQSVQAQTAPAPAQSVQTQTAPVSAQPVQAQSAPVDEGGFLWGLVGYIISIFGIVLFFVMKKRTPKRAKAILTGSLINIGIALLAGVSAGTYTYLRNKAVWEAWAAEQVEEERRRQEYEEEQKRLADLAYEESRARQEAEISSSSYSIPEVEENTSSSSYEMPDDSSMSSSLSEGSYMKVKENLRLRSAASTSSNVVTSMQAGSPVEVVTIGDSETVDGVSSYWVLVTTRAGAKDKDGNSISEGTVGWCFAGFLE